MAKIINEMPDDLDFEGQEIEVKENKDEVKITEKVTKQDDPVQEELDIEIEDDTPKADRNREPLPETIKNELDNDNLEEYSDRVKTRMAQLKKAYHDERREKEKASREKEEASRVAHQVFQENQRLKQTLSAGEVDYLKTLQEKFTSDLAVAQREYKEAYDIGDSDKLMQAQTKMNEAQYKLSQANDRKPQYSKEALQIQQNELSLEQAKTQPRVPQPDVKAFAWQEKNKWFGKDEEMTSLALGVHEKLVRNGVDPSSDMYYRRIDETMQKRFPEYFGDTDSLEEARPAQRKPSTVVAPATRSTSPRKIRLTKTQLALAKKFKLTPEQYARELIKTENTNG